MVALADNLAGELARFVDATVNALEKAITENTERWLHKSLCYHAPSIYTGTFPLTHEEVDFLHDHCVIEVAPHDEWTVTTLKIDGKIVAEMRHRASRTFIQVQYNCKGQIPW